MQTRVLIGVFSFLTFAILYVLIRDYAQAIHSYSIPNVEPYQLEKVEDTKSQTYLKAMQILNTASNENELIFYLEALKLMQKALKAKN